MGCNGFWPLPTLDSRDQTWSISVGFLRGDANHLSDSTGLSLQIIYLFIRCKYIFIRCKNLWKFRSQNPCSAMVWKCGEMWKCSAGQSWRTHFHCHTRIWGWPQFFIFLVETTCPSFTKVLPPWISHGTKALWCLTLELCWVCSSPV